jgi:hypothetical protein
MFVSFDLNLQHIFLQRQANALQARGGTPNLFRPEVVGALALVERTAARAIQKQSQILYFSVSILKLQSRNFYLFWLLRLAILSPPTQLSWHSWSGHPQPMMNGLLRVVS